MKASGDPARPARSGGRLVAGRTGSSVRARTPSAPARSRRGLLKVATPSSSARRMKRYRRAGPERLLLRQSCRRSMGSRTDLYQSVIDEHPVPDGLPRQVPDRRRSRRTRRTWFDGRDVEALDDLSLQVLLAIRSGLAPTCAPSWRSGREGSSLKSWKEPVNGTSSPRTGTVERVSTMLTATRRWRSWQAATSSSTCSRTGASMRNCCSPGWTRRPGAIPQPFHLEHLALHVPRRSALRERRGSCASTTRTSREHPIPESTTGGALHLRRGRHELDATGIVSISEDELGVRRPPWIDGDWLPTSTSSWTS